MYLINIWRPSFEFKGGFFFCPEIGKRERHSLMGDTDIHVGAKENVDNKNPPGPKDTGGRTGNNSKIRTFFEKSLDF